MDFQPTTFTIDRIVRWIDTGHMALPDFQRDFVWSPSKVADLIDSVSRGWPIGSLLLLEGPQPFEPKEINSGPPLRGKVQYFVLDGQQRVTALYHAISDVSSIVYYIDFQALERGEEYVRWAKREDFEKESPTLADQARRGVAKVCDLYDSTRFHEWQRVLTPQEGTRMVALRSKALPGLQEKVYKLIGVSLDQEIALEALARIFETINRTGVRLNAFDLMVAVLYPQGFFLRDEWDTARLEHRILVDLDVDGLEILKLIALLERRNQQENGKILTVKGIRQGDVLAVPPGNVKANWARSISAYTDALNYSRDSLGVVGAKSIPSAAMLLTLAFALDLGVSNQEIRNWFWWSIANQTYAQGANTQVITDVDAMVTGGWAKSRWTQERKEELQRVLLEPVRRNGILTRGIGCLLAVRGAPDPVSANTLAESRTLSFVSIDALTSGKTTSKPDSPIAAQIFLDAASIQVAALAIRRGRGLRDVMDPGGLNLQGFLDGDLGRSVDQEALQRRASILSDLLIEEAGMRAL